MRPSRFILLASAAALAAGAIVAGKLAVGPDREITEFVNAPSPPRIDPDYSGLIIPANCAPLNFSVAEPGIRFCAIIRGGNGTVLRVRSSRSAIDIPIGAWRRLLALNRGGTISFDVFTQGRNGRWTRYAPFTDTIAPDSIDRYLVYRLFPPLYSLCGKMGNYQRDLSTFKEKPIWLNRMTDNNCMNCHKFRNNDPDYMVAHMRGGPGNGTLVVRAGRAIKISTETGFNKPARIPAWHPDGNLIAFSINRFKQFFHATGNNREDIDLSSKIILYNIATNTITTTPPLADPAFLSTQPEWSPDGRYLYYSRAPQFPVDSFASCYTRIWYDLMRIRYDAAQDTWGEPEAVLPHEKTGLSATFPRISPDGRFLVCCMMPWGTFPVSRPGGDIYLVNLQTGAWHRLDVNTAEPESWPSWSSNGRWIVFASKRIDGISMRIYFSRIDSNGVASKPFLLPQEDPRFYDSFLKTYNQPELIKRPIGISPYAIVDVLCDNRHIHKAQIDAKVEAIMEAQKGSKPAAEAGMTH
jgi:Tol biopolymer transport system component